MMTVMGATGHTGKRIAEELLKTGEQVRALGRTASKLVELKNAGAEVLIGDTRDVNFLTTALRGHHRVLQEDVWGRREINRIYGLRYIRFVPLPCGGVNI